MMTLHGADIFIWDANFPQLPEQVGKFKLILMSNRGTRVWPLPAPDFEHNDWYRARYLCDDVVGNPEVDELVQQLTSRGHVWTKLQKLYRLEGVDQFSQPY